MKIIYLHQYFCPPDGAGGTRSYDLAKRFVESGIAIEFITSSADYNFKPNQRWAKIELDGITYNILNLKYDNSMNSMQRMWAFYKFLWFGTFKCLKLKGDIVLATSTPLTIGIPALVNKIFKRTPYIFEVRDVWPEAVIAIGAINNKILQKILFYLEFIIYKYSEKIVPLSTDMANSIINRYESFKDKIQVIENISELDRFNVDISNSTDIIKSKLGFKPRFSILYAGSFAKVNGIKYVIDFAEKLIKIDTSIKFILIGFGAEKSNIIQLAKDKNLLNNNVYILEPVGKNQLPNLYYNVNMGSSFVIPIKELWANSANKFFDTLAAGRPMLINYEGWQKKVINNSNIGYILPPNLNELTEKKLKNFIDYTYDKELLNTQNTNSLNTAKSYSLEEASNKYIKIFNNIIS
ncbi:MAG: glycosyltransferase family 4 protein [Maribacter litoralis]|uniref:glycosyltransferase family 4 protein n=1 Tax=Maribacter litoralis TaxID=2059726 RepID=UPI003299C151